MNDHIEVAMVTPIGPVQKYPSMSSAPNWGFPVSFKLVDGTLVQHRDTGFRRRKDAVEAMEKLPAPPEHMTTLELDEDGQLRGVRTEFSFRNAEFGPRTNYMRVLLVAKANNTLVEPVFSTEDIAIAQEYVNLGRLFKAGEYVPNYDPFVAARVQKLILDPLVGEMHAIERALS